MEMGFEIAYRPILSMMDGSLFGCEAMPVVPGTGKRWDSEAFFASAEERGGLYALDRRFRERAIQGLPGSARALKLFLPIPARIIGDPRLSRGTTRVRIEAAGLRHDQVVLILTGLEAEEPDAQRAVLRHYREQGYRIALFGVGTDRASVRRMLRLKPDYACLSEDWLAEADRDAVDASWLQPVAQLARKEKIALLADGVAREGQIRPLIDSGIGYGLGPWAGEPAPQPGGADRSRAAVIQRESRRRFGGGGHSLTELMEPAVAFPRGTPVSEITQRFEQHRGADGFVIVDGDRPVGLLMKEKLHQMLAWQFGLPLYWSRPVDKIMDPQPLVVERTMPIDHASQAAMTREPDKLYDAIVVTEDGKVTGTVSVRSLLEWVTQARMADAQWANPLTGLPGNEPIRGELARRLDEGRPFAVLYADLDHFKWYNDQYGFSRGDDVIRFTGETMQAVVRDHGADDCFVGHIGGDDFIVMTSAEDPVKMAEALLAAFADGVAAYVDPRKGPVHDRSGRRLDGATLSLSLALLLCQDTAGWTPERLAERSASMKKRAKAKPGHSLVWERLSGWSPEPAEEEAGDLTVR